MLRPLSILLCCLVILQPITLLANPSTTIKLTPEEIKAGYILFHGVKGKFYSSTKLKQLLKDLSSGQKAQELVPKLERRFELEQHRSKLLTLDVKTTEQMSNVWKSTAQDQAKQLAKQHSMWKSPPLWFSIGVIVTTTAFTAVAIALR